MALKGQTRDPNTLRAQYLENYLSSRLQIWYAALYRECRAGAQIILPKSGRGQGHVTPTIFGSTVGYPSDSLASCLFSSQLYSYSAVCNSVQCKWRTTWRMHQTTSHGVNCSRGNDPPITATAPASNKLMSWCRCSATARQRPT